MDGEPWIYRVWQHFNTLTLLRMCPINAPRYCVLAVEEPWRSLIWCHCKSLGRRRGRGGSCCCAHTASTLHRRSMLQNMTLKTRCANFTYITLWWVCAANADLEVARFDLYFVMWRKMSCGFNRGVTRTRFTDQRGNNNYTSYPFYSTDTLLSHHFHC